MYSLLDRRNCFPISIAAASPRVNSCSAYITCQVGAVEEDAGEDGCASTLRGMDAVTTLVHRLYRTAYVQKARARDGIATLAC